MLNTRDLYTYAEAPLLGSSADPFGTTLIQYEMRKYQDIRNLSSELAYLLICKQRIVIPNPTPYQVGPSSSTSFNYPAAITNAITLTVNIDGATIFLKDYFPRTLNAAVSTSANTAEDKSISNSNQYTSGSSTAQSNSFGVSVSTAGFIGDLFGGAVTQENQSSWQSTKSNSLASGTGSARQSDMSSGESMSIKDWNCYGFTDQTDGSVSWIWGQSYPWDVILYNQGTSSSINLPAFVMARMVGYYDSTGTKDGPPTAMVLPPSQLALFGVDFTMRAGWLIKFPQGVSELATATVTHTTTRYLASHQLAGSTFSATLQTNLSASSSTFASSPLDLSTYALDAILTAGRGNGAAIGFTANPFIIAPATSNTFKIVSPSNNLQVTGTGFSANMSTTFTQTVTLTVQFKILDTVNEYSLLLMHWIGQGSGPCKLTITANGNKAWTSVVYVDAVEGQGGQDNVTAVGLRNTDFSSTNYHDYLVIGLNTISITIEAASGGTSQYTLFALGIGQA